MTTDEIEIIIAKHEKQCVELKESFGAECVETACAFANAQGGRIIVGVTDRGEPSKNALRIESLRDYVNKIVTATEPSVVVDAEKVGFRGREIVVLRVSENPVKPVAFKGRCYMRHGATNRQMTPPEIAESHLASLNGSNDTVILSDVKKQDLDLDLVRQYMRRTVAEGRRDFGEDDDPWRVLVKTKLVKNENEISQAAYLLFARNPQEEFPQAVIRAGAFKNGCSEILDTADIKGNIQNQIDEAIAFIKRNIRYGIEVSGKAQSDRYWDYPIDALRETLVNAVCHRDYGSPHDIQVKILEDGLCVASPGSLPLGMTLEMLHDSMHSSRPRNKLIAQVFHDMSFIERYGSGIDRIKDACRKNGNPEPEWRNSPVEVLTVFKPRKRAHDTISDTLNGIEKAWKSRNYLGKIFSESGGGDRISAEDDTIKSRLCVAISKKGGIKREELAAVVGRSVPTVSRYIGELEHEGRVIYRGSKKTGGYFLQ